MRPTPGLVLTGFPREISELGVYHVEVVLGQCEAL